MSRYKLHLKRERRKKRAAQRAAVAQSIDGKKIVEQLETHFGKVRNPIVVGLNKNKI